MKRLQSNNDLESLVVRANFSDDVAWQTVAHEMSAPVGKFQAVLQLVDDREHEGVCAASASEIVTDPEDELFIFLVDHETLSSPDHPVLVVDVIDEPGRSFRVIPSEVWSVQNNLSLANMDWEDFAENSGVDGIFRGFRDS